MVYGRANGSKVSKVWPLTETGKMIEWLAVFFGGQELSFRSVRIDAIFTAF